MRQDGQIEIFVKAGCPYCSALKRKLEREGAAFIEHDVQANPAALQRMLSVNGGQRNVPTIVLGEEVSVGFHGM
jgi:glutaredoxin